MTEKFRRALERMEDEEHGGAIPPEVMRIAQWAEAEATRIVRGKGIHPDVVFELRMRVADLAVRIAREVIYRERLVDGLSEQWWASGFGMVSEMMEDGHETPEDCRGCRAAGRGQGDGASPPPKG